MLILAIDLGKAKSLACWYRADDATQHEFRTVPTRPGDFHTLLGAPARPLIGTTLCSLRHPSTTTHLCPYHRGGSASLPPA